MRTLILYGIHGQHVPRTLYLLLTLFFLLWYNLSLLFFVKYFPCYLIILLPWLSYFCCCREYRKQQMADP